MSDVFSAACSKAVSEGGVDEPWLQTATVIPWRYRCRGLQHQNTARVGPGRSAPVVWLAALP